MRQQNTTPEPRTLAPELLRIAFCAMVVFSHCDLAWIELGIAGVGGFFGLSVAFSATRSDPARLLRRAASLLGLWIAWWPPYLALLVARDLHGGRAPGEGWRWWMLATGPSIHLWFLPALALGLLGIAGLAQVRSRWVRVLLASVAVCAASLVNLDGSEHQWPTPVPQILVTVVACGGAWLVATSRPSARGAWGWLGAPVALGGVLLAISHDPMRIGILLVAAGAALACRTTSPATPGPVRALSAWTGGIYLVHVAAIFAWRALLPSAPPIAVAAAVLATSAIATAAARRTPFARLFP